MAHNINYSNGRYSVFVTEKPAWHELGVVVENAVTSEEAIQLANLDYEVVKSPIFTQDQQLIPDNFATVRKDTNVPLGIVGNVYKILQNREAFKFFDDVVATKEAMYHTAGALGNGERIWMLAKLPKNLIIKNIDEVEKYLLLTNSHDGTSTVKLFFTSVRVVCNNTLNLAMKDAKGGISIRHSGLINSKMSEARRILGLSLQYFDEFGVTAGQFADKQLTVDMADNYFNNVLEIDMTQEDESSTRKLNQKNRLLQLFEHGKGNDQQAIRHTLWAALNAVTEYADHELTVKKEKEDPTNRLKSIWFGNSAVLKTKAFDIAKSLVLV